MVTLNEYFDKIYCLNLERRPDRWEESTKVFKNLNLSVDKFPAFDGQTIDLGYGKPYNGDIGCGISHIKVLKSAIENKLKNVLILEDDVMFSDNLLEIFQKVTLELPDDWDILFFGGNHQGGALKISENIARVYNTYTTHCYAINSKCFETIYKHMVSKIEYVLNCGYKLDECVAVDYYMAQLHRKLNVYSVYPNIAWQRESYSDIQQDVRNYDHILKIY